MRLMLLMLSMLMPMSAAWAECDKPLIRAKVIQDIEYLRRAYARATDAIGKDTETDVASGRAIYQRIFTTDAQIGAHGIEGRQTGPDAWVTVVRDALGPMGPTQHFIGTQIVDLERLELDESCAVRSGDASMNSYVQAWHVMEDGKIWLFVGNYADKVAFRPGVGWQIHDMYLERITEEFR